MKNVKQSISLFIFIIFSIKSFAFTDANTDISALNSLYIGIEGGYGSTVWSGLVPEKKNLNSALMMSTPIAVSEGGGIAGIFGGYEFMPNFALEAHYIRFPQARVFFDADSLFSFENEGAVELDTYTETSSLMAKLMLPIFHSDIRAYSSAGIAGIHRWDFINDRWRFTPTFGVGINYKLTAHIFAELAGNYAAGYGQSTLNPAEDYIPFLYSVVLRLGYQF